MFWTDVSQGGPSGTYTVTYQPEPLGSCFTAPDDVIYTVTIINECELAVFTIDPLIFLESPAITSTHFIMQDPVTLTWNSITDITSSVASPDPCGPII